MWKKLDIEKQTTPETLKENWKNLERIYQIITSSLILIPTPLAVLAGGSARTKSEKSISRPDKISPPGQNLYAPGHENWYIFTHRNLDSISAARQWRNAIKHRLKILVKTSLTSCLKLARTLALARRDHFVKALHEPRRILNAITTTF